MEDTFDTARPLGIQTRLRTMDMLAAQRMRALVYHLPWPGLPRHAGRAQGARACVLRAPTLLVLGQRVRSAPPCARASEGRGGIARPVRPEASQSSYDAGDGRTDAGSVCYDDARTRRWYQP